jgi:hypothetical protein
MGKLTLEDRVKKILNPCEGSDPAVVRSSANAPFARFPRYEEESGMHIYGV